MLLSARPIVLAILLFALSASGDDVEPTEDELKRVRPAVDWMTQADLEPVSRSWPYRVGSPQVCRSTLIHLANPAFDEAWVLADLDRDIFWLLVTKGYFGASHYYGPVRMNADGNLEISPVGDGAPKCER
jgi:hypothetical protein